MTRGSVVRSRRQHRSLLWRSGSQLPGRITEKDDRRHVFLRWENLMQAPTNTTVVLLFR